MDIYGTNGIDNLTGTNINDRIYGFAGNDILKGGDGHDRLDGGLGADSMAGGNGDDVFIVNSMADTITELAGQGNDTVISFVDTDIEWLPNNVENLTLSGTATYGDGNSLDNVIRGTNSVNYLYGLNGNDTLFGNGGNDFLVGGNGNDKLDGGLGGDQMFGGAGNDSYYVDSVYNTDKDTITESNGEGIDTVTISSSAYGYEYYLPEHVENLILNGALPGEGVKGNSLNNVMISNSTNFRNHMYGDSGNDTLIGNDRADSLAGGYGNDQLSSGAGEDDLHGAQGNDILIAGAGNDYLDGNTGNDILNGGVGIDRLWGDWSTGGADTFILGYRGSANADFIGDFNHQDDVIHLTNSLDAGMSSAISPGIKGLVFTNGNIPGNILNSGWYFEGSGLTGNNSSNQFSGIYVNTTSGEIWYNPTNNSISATDAEIIGRVNVSAAASLDYTDFVYGG